MAVLFGGIHSGGIVQTPAGTWVDGQKIDRDFAPGETRKTIRTANGTVVEMKDVKPGEKVVMSMSRPSKMMRAMAQSEEDIYKVFETAVEEVLKKFASET